MAQSELAESWQGSRAIQQASEQGAPGRGSGGAMFLWYPELLGTGFAGIGAGFLGRSDHFCLECQPTGSLTPSVLGGGDAENR